MQVRFPALKSSETMRYCNKMGNASNDNYFRLSTWRKYGPFTFSDEYRRQTPSTRMRKLKRDVAEYLAMMFSLPAGPVTLDEVLNSLGDARNHYRCLCAGAPPCWHKTATAEKCLGSTIRELEIYAKKEFGHREYGAEESLLKLFNDIRRYDEKVSISSDPVQFEARESPPCGSPITTASDQD